VSTLDVTLVVAYVLGIVGVASIIARIIILLFEYLESDE
jgi:hypothetical protein